MKVLDKHIERGDDPTGHGDYGKSRGRKRNQGLHKYKTEKKPRHNSWL